VARNLAAVARALPTTVANPTGAFGGPPTGTGLGGPASPLIASYAEWSTGRVNAALPRDPATFLNGTFGPLAPMRPQPIDQPPPGEDRPEPRRFTYPTSWNMPHGQPGDEGLKLASFSQMRIMADAYSVARACIQLRIQEILAIEWDVVPTKDAEKAMRGDRAARKEFDERRGPVKRFFNRPDPGKYHGFESWLSALLEEIFVVDALSLYLQPSRQRGKARGIPGSNLGALCLISGDIVRPMLDLRGGIPQPPNPAWQIYQYGVPRVDLMTSWMGEDVKDMKDALTTEYRADQMMYLPFTPRSWTPYGLSLIEQALVPITSGLQRQQWQLDYYSQGSTPGIFLSTGDPNSTPNQCRELQDALNAMAGDPAWKHKIIVIPGGSKIDPIRPTPLADQFDEIVMTQVCMAFDVMPMELGISTSGSKSAMGAASQIAKASEKINERKALKPLLKWLKANIFDYAIREHMGQPDMQWHWEGLEEGEDEAATVEVLVNEMTHGLVSIDEARVIRGHQPWGIPMTSEPVYFTATGITPLGSIDMSTGAPVGAPPANAMQAAAGVVPGAPPAFGGGPGGPGKPGGGGGKPKPKGPNGPKGPGGGAPTPAHAGAQAAAGGQMLPAHPKPLPKPVLAHQDPDSPLDRKPINKAADRYVQRALLAKGADLGTFYEDDEPVEQVKAAFDRGPRLVTTVDVPAALRELDLIGHRLTKGAGLNGWVNRHLPADVFDTLRADGDVAKARMVVKDAGQRQRRDTALAATQQQVINSLHDLAAQVGDGSLSTPGFIDAAVALLRSSIHEGLRLGTGHALVDAGRATQRTAWATKATGDGPGWVDGLDGRFGLYAGTVAQAYEMGYGLATIGAHDNPDNIVIEWHARPDACDLCDTWSTMLHTADTLPGMPGQGGFGADATVCEGGPRCRCRLAYRLASPAEVEAIQLRHADTTPTPEQLAAADQRAQDAQAIRRALNDDDPNAALALVLADLADERAEAQRSWLMGLLKDILTAATRGANALRTWLVTKAAKDDEPDPGAAVTQQMRENYPPKALGWMKGAQWSGPVDVPLDSIDFDDIDRWAASHDKARVKHFAKQLRKGNDVKPVVAVQEPGGDKIKIIDGHHRTLAARENGQPVRAYVGTVDADGGPWDETHVWQFHHGADPANKIAGADLDKGRLPPGPRDWKEHPWSHGWVWHGPTAVGTTIDHKGFGKGHVTGVTKTRIKVIFPDGKERTFPHAAGIAPNKTHGAGRHRAPQAAKDGKKKLAKDLLDDVSSANGKEVTDPAALDAAKNVFEGVHGGLSVKLKKLAADDGYFEADLSIHDHTGQQIGHAVRTIGRDEDGNLFATHVLLKVSADTRGQGFAQSFNRQLEDWYRESGIQRIELRADIDVGGYAWSRAGYTWRDGKVPSSIRDRLVQAIAPHRSHDYHVDFDKDGNYTVTTNGESLGSYEFYDDAHTAIGMHALDSSPDTPERREAKALLARIDAGEHVTPFEISQLGRPAGAGRDDTWPGKLALLGSDWEGVKWL